MYIKSPNFLQARNDYNENMITYEFYSAPDWFVHVVQLVQWLFGGSSVNLADVLLTLMS